MKRLFGRYIVIRFKVDFEVIVKELNVKGDVFFNRVEGNREYRCFKYIKGSFWGNLNYG